MTTNDTTKIAISNTLNAGVCTQLTEICKPLEPLGINAFFYSNFQDMNRVNLLSNNFKWLEHLQDHLDKYPLRFQNTFHFRPGFSIDYLNYFNANQMSQDMIECGMKNAIYLTNVSKDKRFSEVFIFTTATCTEISNQMLSNNIDYFNQFCLSFKDKASSIIKKTRVNNIHTLGYDQSHIQLDKKIDQSHNLKRYYLGSPYDNVYLTNKEFHYLKEYLSGDSIKKIAALYSISPRTIESALTSVKQKLGCHGKSELLEIISTSQLFYPIFCK